METREILFRAWDLDNKEMYYQDRDQRVAYERPNQYVMQYTGLTDRNGVKIYEHDVLKFGESIYVVRWHSQKALFGVFFPDNVRLASYPFTDSDRYEIVGNIHQNPELL